MFARRLRDVRTSHAHCCALLDLIRTCTLVLLTIAQGAKSSKGSRRGRYGSDEDASGGDESEAEYDEGSEESDASSEGEGCRRRPTTRSSAGATTSGDEVGSA